jgi:Holliday junction resolvasome RuvABC DNA-binding subunit
MIGSLRGRLLECGQDGHVLLEVGGVGYRITVTPTTAYRLGEASADEVFVHVHHHIREADQAPRRALRGAPRSRPAPSAR